MIDSPAQRVDLLVKSNASLVRKGTASTNNEEIHKKTRDLTRGNGITCYFLRMSWVNKLKFFDDLIERVNSLETITILLNTLHSCTGKVTSYCKSSTTTPINFDKVLNDHNRMLDDDLLGEMIPPDLSWFEAQDEKDQVAYLITLLRFSGGDMVRVVYKKLQTIYAQRLRRPSVVPIEKKQSKTEEKSQEKEDTVLQMLEEHHDSNDPKHKKVLELQKAWHEALTKYRKDIEQRTPKVKNGKDSETGKKGKKNKKKKDKSSKKNKKSKKSKKKEKENQDELDWVQLMPIWIVKKIFAYLDKKTLNKAKKVNAYWKWAIGELLKDMKVRKVVNKANNKLKDAAGGDCTLPGDAILAKPKPRISHTERRIKKLEQRGAIIEPLRLAGAVFTDTHALVLEAIKHCPDTKAYVDELIMHPRKERTNSPIYKKPAYIIKDLNIICRDSDDMSDSLEGVTINISEDYSITSIASDRDII